jgi:transcriptional regulator GlxA family with amidase domain
MWENVEEHIDLLTIATAVGCSVRKLLYTFKCTHGVGAVRYLKTQRLCAVHRILLEGECHRTIADIAADYGFWHMGHFGVDYKTQFGMTPSQTRRAANRLSAALRHEPARVERGQRAVAATCARVRSGVTPRALRHAWASAWPIS